MDNSGFFSLYSGEIFALVGIIIGAFLGFLLSKLGRKGNIKVIHNRLDGIFFNKNDSGYMVFSQDFREVGRLSIHIEIYLYNSSFDHLYIKEPRIKIRYTNGDYLVFIPFKEKIINIDPRQIYLLKESHSFHREDDEDPVDWCNILANAKTYFMFDNKGGKTKRYLQDTDIALEAEKLINV